MFWVDLPDHPVGFQLLFNGVLTGRGVVRYDPAAILGPRLVNAPVEDLVFGFALVLPTPVAVGVVRCRRATAVVEALVAAR